MARRVFTAEFKREAVRLASQAGVTRKRVAQELGIHPNVLCYWIEQFKSGAWEAKPGAVLRSAPAQELERLALFVFCLIKCTYPKSHDAIGCEYGPPYGCDSDVQTDGERTPRLDRHGFLPNT